MKLHLLSAGLLSALVTLAGPNHLPFGGLPAMVKKANADDSGKALRAPSVPPARDPSAAVAEEFEAARREGNTGSARASPLQVPAGTSEAGQDRDSGPESTFSRRRELGVSEFVTPTMDRVGLRQ